VTGGQHRPAQHGAQPGQQFARRECLRQIIVGAHLQAHDAIRLLAATGQYQHWSLRMNAQTAQHFEPVHAGQHHVENHGVE
jgi:hypothetical protein